MESDGGGAELPGGNRIEDLPDIDRLEGYDANMECDPPADYYDAYIRNEQNMYRLNKFIANYLVDTGRRALHIDEVGGPAYPSCCTQFLENATGYRQISLCWHYPCLNKELRAETMMPSRGWALVAVPPTGAVRDLH